jgi:Zn-dependent protease with chaperone function
MTTTLPDDPAARLLQLAQPSPAYKRKVWLAVAGLALFLVLYFLLAGWFLWTAYRLTVGADQPTFTGYLVGVCALFLGVFMVKPLFFVKRGSVAGAVEITRQEQPRLFAYLDELADQATAPRPHRVFVSAQVNAMVFYDLSLLNLIVPSRKNLEIGLGLVNALTLGECRAVLAHEFGHFSQRSMAVMRWSHIGHQIAAYLVARRDRLDAFLQALSRFDLRVAWVGWGLSLIVWSIRSLVASAFSLVVRLQLALSREMEFQADLVAVSLTGSDALIHALHRLQAADDSWGRTLDFVRGEVAKQHIARDFFALHARVLERVRDVLADPGYGDVPPVPAERPAEHRVFKPELAQAPLMWLSHPPNHDREANAKRSYIGAAIDERSAWTLFDDAAALRERVSAVLLQSKGKETVPVEDSLAALDQEFGTESFQARYRGLYLSRSVVRAAPRPDALVDPAPEGWKTLLDELYPSSLTDDIARLRELQREIGQLQALQSGALQPPEGVIRHRGRVIARKDLPHAIEAVQQEARLIDDRLQSHDRLCRSVHRAAAAELGGGWAPYLEGLLNVLHYADHTVANLRDLHALLSHTVHLVTLTRRVSSSGRERVVHAANDLHRALGEVVMASKEVRLDRSLLERLKTASWPEYLGSYSLVPANTKNIGEWLKVIDGWVAQIAGACNALRFTALEQLLVSEAAVARHARENTTPELAPEPSRPPRTYDALLPGAERKRPTGLNWWERFQIADGIIPGIARFAVAAGIVGAVLGLGRSVGTATITIYNGLARPVVVSVGDRHVGVRPLGWNAIDVPAGRAFHVEARTAQGQVVDTLDAEVPGSFAQFVYNVAGVGPLLEWTAVYGDVSPRPSRALGVPHWTRTAADVLFEDPPQSISTEGGGGTRLVLSGLADQGPGQQLSVLANAADRARVMRAHARWDATTSRSIISWMAFAATELPDYHAIVAARVAETPDDVLLLRLEQDAATPAEKVTLCARARARADAAPDNADLAYVASRCLAGTSARNLAFMDGYRRWPANGWFAQAVGYTAAEAGRWQEGIQLLEAARRVLRPLSEELAVDLARLYRMSTPDPAAAIAELAKSSDHLRYYLTLESGVGLDSSPLLAYSELAQGHLERALQLAAADSEVAPRVIRLAAASDGATPAMISRARSLAPAAGMDYQTRWAAIGLAARLGDDYTALVESGASSTSEAVAPLLAFIERVRAGKDLPGAEQMLQDLPLVMRGEAYSLAVVVLGPRAPVSWRRAAQRLLFVSERPYFGSAK